jgi:hypothetical protein
MEIQDFKEPVRRLKKSATWQRITVALLGIAVEVGIWQWAVWHLYSLPPESVSSFTTITVNCFYVIAALVLFFVTGKLIYDLKVDTVAQVVTEGKALIEKKYEKIEKLEHVIIEGDVGAPERRPFNPDSKHDEEEA